MPIYNRIAEFHDDMTEWRHDIHAHPELCFEEHRTSKIVAEKLESWGIEVHTGLAKTGVVGVLRGQGNSTRTVGLRADLDALPMQEANDFHYKSIHDGKMHACGHDGHTIMLLGAARYLSENKNFDGTVHFIFQPAEEGGGGAKVMIDEGLFDRFPCDQVYGMHNYSSTPAGTFSIRPNAFMASADSCKITINGVGGHAAWPNKCIDPIAIGVQLHTSLQTIISRNTNPVRQAVLSITQFHGGSANNVISDTAQLDMSIRALDNETRAMIRRRVFEISEGIAKANGIEITVEYEDGYPVLVNDPRHMEIAADIAASIVGEQKVDREADYILGSEDFAFMLEEKPGAYIFLGQADDQHTAQLHQTEYDFNDDVSTIGASFWAAMVEQSMPRE